MSDVVAELRTLPSVFRSGEAVAAGVSWRDLYRLRDAGELVELSRGVFQLADRAGGGHVDFVAVCRRVPRSMICLNSALAYWELTDELPPAVHLAVPRGAHRPQIDYPRTVVHVFAADTFDVGRVEQGDPGERFWLSDRERTVADGFRRRHELGEPMAFEALRRYLARPAASPGRLAELARMLRIEGPLLEAMRVLLP